MTLSGQDCHVDVDRHGERSCESNRGYGANCRRFKMSGNVSISYRNFLLATCLFLFAVNAPAGAASLTPIVVNCIFGDSPAADIQGQVGDTVVIRVVGGRCDFVKATQGSIVGPGRISQNASETFTLVKAGRGSISMVSLWHEKIIKIPFVVVAPGPRGIHGLNFLVRHENAH